MNIDFANLNLQYQKYKDDIDANIQAVLNKSNYIMGEEVYELERALESFTGAKNAITCSSGTSALLLAMMAIDIQPGDEIITTPFTFIATAETIALMKAKPVFVDIEPDTFNIDATKIEAAITERTKAIVAVSLYGQPPDIDALEQIKNKHTELKVIIDGAQSFGSTYKGKADSALGDISITSFFPSKPLGCYGDGGAVFTNNDTYAEIIKMMRIHGQSRRYHHKYIGIGGRMDTIQAAVLLAKLPRYAKELKSRQEVADLYSSQLSTLNSELVVPSVAVGRTSTWAQYTVRVKNREKVRMKLIKNGIPTAVYYPMPLHVQVCFQYLKYHENDFPVALEASKSVVSLPMNSYLSVNEILMIVQSLNDCTS